MDEREARKRPFLIITPLLLLLLCLLSLNLGRWLNTPSINETITTPIVISPTLISTPTLLPITLTQTPAPTPHPTLPTPTPTDYAPPTFNDDDMIQLLGPPPDSTFNTDSTISFYWHWTLPLSADQFFEVYLITENEKISLGTVREPNLGNKYRLHITLKGREITADSALWLVQLQSTQSNQPLRLSNPRKFSFLSSTLSSK